jgi:Flp pilus assembly protein TadB
MTSYVVALLFLAAAVTVQPNAARYRLASLAGTRPGRIRVPTQRLLPFVAAVPLGVLVTVMSGWLAGVPVSVAAWFGARRVLRERPPVVDPLRLAACWDLLGACLRAGLPVSTAVRAVAGRVPGDCGEALRSTADLLALGADPIEAWRPAAVLPQTAALARGARRTARSGTELAAVAAALAAELRASAGELSEARAQRAGVLITGPLGLCFLPAFVCLGIVPVIAGLAGRLELT